MPYNFAQAQQERLACEQEFSWWGEVDETHEPWWGDCGRKPKPAGAGWLTLQEVADQQGVVYLISAEDWHKAAGHFTLEESRRQSSGYLVMFAMISNNDKEAAAILKKHGLDPQDVVSQLAATKTGQEEFVHR